MPLSPITHTPEEHNGLSENPWVESNDPEEITDDSLSKPVTNSPKPRSRTPHVRSQTTAGHPLGPSSPSSVDEWTGVLGRGSSLDLHETRPSLRRAIHASSEEEGSFCLKGGTTNGNEGAGAERRSDAEVIVHQVLPTDSLPGVALKYNITLAALRSANKLWANDSIHLRQILYIPVHSITATAKSVPPSPRVRPGLVSPPMHSAPDVRTQTPSHIRRSTSEWNASNDEDMATRHSAAARTISAGTPSTIKRVPLSELSFFPPPSTPATPPSRRSRPRPLLPVSPTPRRPTPSQFNTISAAPRVTSPTSMPFFSAKGGKVTPPLGLTSFLNGARGEIVSRLSFDSARGSSDTGDDPEVEMDVVRSVNGRSRDVKAGNATVRGVKAGLDGAAAALNGEFEADPASVVLNTPRKLKPKAVRTVQLQPSSKMEIPPTVAVLKLTNGNESTSGSYDRR